MWKNYVKVALRALRRQRGHTAINVVGLALGLACCVVIFQYVAFERSFDRFHAHERDLYRVTTAAAKVGEPLGAGPHTPHAMGPAFAEAVPELAGVARLHPAYHAAVVSSPARPERVFEETRVFYADPAFLTMFSFPLVSGDAKTALADPGAALVSEATARRYFGPANPVGQTLDVAGEIDRSYRVAGVFRDVPAASHLQFDLLLPVSSLIQEAYTDPDGAWSWNNFLTYVQLRPGADRGEAERKMTAVLRAHYPEAWREQGFVPHVRAQPLRDVHLDDAVGGAGGSEVMGSRRTVYFFTVIGLVTLLIALVNYVNLATARAIDRAREVGVRKAVGAYRPQLVAQFLVESALTVAAAAVLAVGLAVLLTPVVNRLAETGLTASLWLSPAFWAAFLAVLAAGALLAGVYPALVLSGFRPAAALRGRAGAGGGGGRLRQGLVVLQFVASIVLIAGTGVVRNQLAYMRERDLGLDLERVLTVNAPRVLPEGTDAEAATATFVDEVRRLPAVRQVATSQSLPGQGFNWNGASVRKAEDDPASTIRGVITWVDTSFAALYGMELVAGNGAVDFTPPDTTDAPFALIPTVTAVKTLGFADPADAVGQTLDVGGNAARIVGVFADVDWTSAHEARPNVFFGRTTGGDRVSIRASTDDLPGTIAAVRATYDRLYPGNVFAYAFADEAFDRQYRDDQRFATLFTLFAGLAVAIACLGLFGLATFTARQRTKEIGVRKVLGASVPALVALLSRDFLRLVGLAVVVASPVAFFLMRGWLDGFAYRVGLGPGAFVVAGALALVVALLTVSVQAFRAAQADPVRALRSE